MASVGHTRRLAEALMQRGRRPSNRRAEQFAAPASCASQAWGLGEGDGEAWCCERVWPWCAREI